MILLSEYLEYIILLALILLIAKLIRKYCRGSLTLDIVRLVFFFSPFLILFLFYGKPNLKFEDASITAFLISIGASLAALLIQYKHFKPYFDIAFYYLVALPKKRILFSIEVGLLLSPFFEELLYRYYLPKTNLVIDLLFSALLFSSAHYLNDLSKSALKFKDYLILFFLGGCWHLSFLLSGSIVPAMIGHLIYNLPNAVITYLRYRIPNNYKTTEERI